MSQRAKQLIKEIEGTNSVLEPSKLNRLMREAVVMLLKEVK